jgi:hypothetical protein
MILGKAFVDKGIGYLKSYAVAHPDQTMFSRTLKGT